MDRIFISCFILLCIGCTNETQYSEKNALPSFAQPFFGKWTGTGTVSTGADCPIMVDIAPGTSQHDFLLEFKLNCNNSVALLLKKQLKIDGNNIFDGKSKIGKIKRSLDIWTKTQESARWLTFMIKVDQLDQFLNFEIGTNLQLPYDSQFFPVLFFDVSNDLNFSSKVLSAILGHPPGE